MIVRATVAGVILGCAVSGLSAPKQAKYLGTIGPTTLRIETPLVALVKYPLLPLQMEPPTPPKVTELSNPPNAPTNNVPEGVEAPRVEIPQEAAPEPVAKPESAETSTASPTTGNVITPQMFLRFFNKDGTRETGVLVSTNLPPGRPANSSSASYNLR